MTASKIPFLNRLQDCLIEVDLKKGAVLFVEGSKTASAYFIVNGVVELSRHKDDESFNGGFKFSKNTELSVGDVFGACKILYKQKGQQYTAIAKTDTKLLVITADLIRKKISEADPFTLYLFRHGR